MIADVIQFNEFLDSTIDPKNLDEDFITSRQVELEDISKHSDAAYLPLVALSYAKLLELTVLLTGKCADNCQIVEFGDLVVNPRHMDVCILNTRLVQEDYGVTDCVPLWFKRQVRARIGSHYAEDLGRMVVDPALLVQFLDEGLLLRTEKKERHGRLSDQFRYCVSDDPQSAFSAYVEEGKQNTHNPGKVLGCGRARTVCHHVASWLADSTVLNIVKGALKTDLVAILRGVMSTDYLNEIDKKFEKAFSSMNYVSMARKNFVNFPYDDDVNISEWAEINNALCHFNLDGYAVIQSELDKILSSPYYRSHLLDVSLYNAPLSQGSSSPQVVRSIM
ncbi:hypothetical protein BerOc1_02488 [Pseudodesulfovibrio hydrargyri]|uniref:Uncharacterized protein n=2 Tax=Pseudodesulfovibrio hydrargyri TaxID=2125990 RepID=A0A1J5MXJ4_9BACT|nr:hypothetical protein BerOc1_02488 [Pseudodesulfovibrio hydrargyri]